LSPYRRETRPIEAVYNAILEIATNPAKSTHIIYGANLASSLFLTYASFLQSRGLIERLEDKTWLTTERGKEYLSVYSQLQRLLDHVEPTTPSFQDNS
jgi:predicted transcriptional regulator